MTILQTDLKYFSSEEVSDAATNGGYMSEDEAITGDKNNVWPNVSADERVAGLTRYRKLFASPRSDSQDTLISPHIWNHGPTPADDNIILFAGTKSDTQATLVESTFYAAGELKNDVTNISTSLTITVEDVSMVGGFHANDILMITNKSDPSDTVGDAEYVTLNATAPAVSGNDVTVYFDTPLSTGYLAASSVVSSCLVPGDSSTSVGSIVVTSTSGTVDSATYAPVLNNTGTKDENITATFTDATNFTVSGSRSGSLGSGNVTTDFTAINPDNSKVLITLLAGFFGGTFAALDTVVIPTIGNNTPFWLKQTVPAGADSLSGDLNVTAYRGEY